MKIKYINLYTKILNEYEKLSTCDRLHVAALLVKDGRVLSVGYNGVADRQTHCSFYFKHENGKFYIHAKDTDNEYQEVSEQRYREEHHNFAERYEIHAEMNCIAFALKNKIDVSGCELVLSVAPCMNCAKLIASAGIQKVTYARTYDRSMEGEKYLESLGISCKPMEKIN